MERHFLTGGPSVEKAENGPAWLNRPVHTLNQRLENRFGDKIEDVPAKDAIKLPFRVVQVLAEKLIQVRLHFALLFFAGDEPLDRLEEVGRIQLMPKAGNKADVSLRSGTQIKNL